MRSIASYKHLLLTIALIISCCIFFTRCLNQQNNTERKPPAKKDPLYKKISFEQYAGMAVCANCHQSIHHSQRFTAHHLSTRPASDSSIKGSFERGDNYFPYNDESGVAMEKTDSGFYQLAYQDGRLQQLHRFDIVVGSAAIGQTSLYWSGSRLFQLPISYFSAAKQWSNSPGYPKRAMFTRPITSRCLECHSTFAGVISADGVEPESFDSSRIIYGIDCERCHGPGAQHAAWQLQHPHDTTAKFIVNASHLSRQQQLEACGVCHGGRLQKTKPSFSFVTGDKLTDYFTPDMTPPDPDKIDLHGNQYGLLRASKCFRNSETLTCTTCHNPHENERGKTAVFVQRCEGCHNKAGHDAVCKMTDSISTTALRANCINCHMPARASNAISMFLKDQEKLVSAQVRSHYISVYAGETRKVLDGLPQKGKGAKRR